MALTDIKEYLESANEIDSGDLNSISTVIIERFQKENQTEILSIAVKVLALVSSREKPPTNDISKELIKLTLTCSKEMRDIYVLGIKSLINNIKDIYGGDLKTALLNRDGLFSLINHNDPDIRIIGFQLYTLFYNRFGNNTDIEYKVIEISISNVLFKYILVGK